MMKPLSHTPLNDESDLPSLASVSQPVEKALTPAEAIEALGRRAMTLSQAHRCAIFVFQKDNQVSCLWSNGLSQAAISQMVVEAANQGKTFFFPHTGPNIIADTRRHPAALVFSTLSREENYRSLHIWPALAKGGVVAAICCFYNKPHSPTRAEFKAMTSFSRQAGSVLSSLMRPQAEQRPVALLDELYDLSRQLVTDDELETMLQRFVQSTVEIANISFCRVMVLQADGNFQCQAAYPMRAPNYPHGQIEPQAAQLVYRRMLYADEPFLLRRNDIALSKEARLALELDVAHSLCLLPLTLEAEPVGILVLGETRSNETLHIEKLRLAAMVGGLISTVIQRERLYHRLEESYLETILALTRSLEARDPYSAGHSHRLVDLVEKTGKRLGCSSERLQSMHWASMLHDIGKIGVPDEILRRPGPLSEDEWEIMKRHPQIGADIITPITSLAHVAPFILAHHEHYDGHGYPEGLRGEEIPLEARILSVVDAYCAMTDGRVYQAAKNHEQAVHELRRCAGTHFDPLVVEVFLTLFD